MGPLGFCEWVIGTAIPDIVSLFFNVVYSDSSGNITDISLGAIMVVCGLIGVVGSAVLARIRRG